jgi:hypothetical protein
MSRRNLFPRAGGGIAKTTGPPASGTIGPESQFSMNPHKSVPSRAVQDNTTPGNEIGINNTLLGRNMRQYSDWVYDKMLKMRENAQTATLLNENPAQNRRHYLQDKEVFMKQFSNFAIENPDIMADFTYDYARESAIGGITELFPMQVSTVQTIIQEFRTVMPHIPTIGTFGVPFRNIASRITGRQSNMIRTKQGFRFSRDFILADPLGALILWNRFTMAVVTNLMSYIYLQATNMLNTWPSAYMKENQLYPGGEPPTNVVAVHKWQSDMFFIVNKQPQGLRSVKKYADDIFQQAGRSCKGLLVNKDLVWYARSRDPSEYMYYYSGQTALEGRVGTDKTAPIDGARIYPIPLGRGRLHDPFFRPIMMFPFQTGTWAYSPEQTLHVKPEDYRSAMRDVGLCAITKNGFHTYTLLDILKHSPEFFPLTYGNAQAEELADEDGMEDDHDDGDTDATSGHAGQIIAPLLWGLIASAQDTFEGQMQTRFYGNEERLSVLVKYNREHGVRGVEDGPVFAGNQRYAPIAVFGEMSRLHAPTTLMNGVYDTVEYQIVHQAGLTPDAITHLERGLTLARELNSMDARAFGAVLDLTAPVIQLARPDVNHRDYDPSNKAALDEPDVLCLMHAPDANGGPAFDPAKMQAASKAKRPMRPAGLGSIAGFMTVAEVADRYPGVFNEADVATIKKFVPAYRLMVMGAAGTTHRHAGLASSLIPMVHNSAQMSTEKRRMIVAWSTFVTQANRPYVLATTDGTAIMTQLVTDSLSNGFQLKVVPDSSAPLEFTHKLVKTANTDVFERQHVHGFGGTLFAALPYVDPQLPALGGSGNLTDALRMLPEGRAINYKRQKDGATSRAFHETNADFHVTDNYGSLIYTKDFHEHLESSPVLARYPRFVRQAIANPMAHAGSKVPTDFELTMLQSHAARVMRGIAMRFLALSTVSIPTLQRMAETNIRIPFNGYLLRLHETQLVECGHALAATKVGVTHYTPLDKTLSKSTLVGDISVQMSVQTQVTVDDPGLTCELFPLAGRAFMGGKTHMIVNEGSSIPFSAMETTLEALRRCDVHGLGDRSIIAVIGSYASAIGQPEFTEFDVRNNYRRECYAGQIAVAPEFVTERSTVAYSAAPIINYLIPNWENGERDEILDQRSLNQRMRTMEHNYVARLGLMQIWDPSKGRRKTHPYTVWSLTDQDGCTTVQQSLGDVVRVK